MDRVAMRVGRQDQRPSSGVDRRADGPDLISRGAQLHLHHRVAGPQRFEPSPAARSPPAISVCSAMFRSNFGSTGPSNAMRTSSRPGRPDQRPAAGSLAHRS